MSGSSLRAGFAGPTTMQRPACGNSLRGHVREGLASRNACQVSGRLIRAPLGAAGRACWAHGPHRTSSTPSCAQGCLHRPSLPVARRVSDSTAKRYVAAPPNAGMTAEASRHSQTTGTDNLQLGTSTTTLPTLGDTLGPEQDLENEHRCALCTTLVGGGGPAEHFAPVRLLNHAACPQRPPAFALLHPYLIAPAGRVQQRGAEHRSGWPESAWACATTRLADALTDAPESRDAPPLDNPALRRLIKENRSLLNIATFDEDSATGTSSDSIQSRVEPPSPCEPQPEASSSGSRAVAQGCPVYVMLPLDTVWVLERDGKKVSVLKKERSLEIALHTLKQAGVEGVMVDVWWGIVERGGPRQFDFSAYAALFRKVLVPHRLLSLHALHPT